MIQPMFETSAAMAGRFEDAKTATCYIRAGRATITLRSAKTQTRFTFEIEKVKDMEAHWVRVLTSSDSFQYLGMVTTSGKFVATKKTPDTLKSAACFKAFEWSWRALAERKRMPTTLEVWHEGSCGRCGRKLTVPESIADGLGPECRKKAR